MNSSVSPHSINTCGLASKAWREYSSLASRRKRRNVSQSSWKSPRVTKVPHSCVTAAWVTCVQAVSKTHLINDALGSKKPRVGQHELQEVQTHVQLLSVAVSSNQDRVGVGLSVAGLCVSGRLAERFHLRGSLLVVPLHVGDKRGNSLCLGLLREHWTQALWHSAREGAPSAPGSRSLLRLKDHGPRGGARPGRCPESPSSPARTEETMNRP